MKKLSFFSRPVALILLSANFAVSIILYFYQYPEKIADNFINMAIGLVFAIAYKYFFRKHMDDYVNFATSTDSTKEKYQKANILILVPLIIIPVYVFYMSVGYFAFAFSIIALPEWKERYMRAVNKLKESN